MDYIISHAKNELSLFTLLNTVDVRMGKPHSVASRAYTQVDNTIHTAGTNFKIWTEFWADFVPSLDRIAPSNWVTDSCLPLGWHVRIKVVNVSSGTYWGRENQEKDGQIKKIHKWFAAQIWPILIRICINDRTLRNGGNIYWFYGVFWHLNQYGVGSRICKIYLRGKLWQCGGKFSEIIQIG